MRTSALAAALSALALAGCAGGPRPLGTSGFLGVGLCPAQDGLQIVDVRDGTPAEKAKLREGDVIVGYRDLDLSAPGNRERLIVDLRTRPGKRVELKLKRGAELVTAKPKLQSKPLYPWDEVLQALTEEIASGRSVAVAVVVDRVDHTRPQLFDGAASLEAWRTGMRGELANYYEGLLLNRVLRRCGTYSVADRAKTDEVLKELHFQMSGAVSPETARRVGKMLGASHLLFVSLTRFQEPSRAYMDQTSLRLVAVESGTVVASTGFSHQIRRQ